MYIVKALIPNQIHKIGILLIAEKTIFGLHQATSLAPSPHTHLDVRLTYPTPFFASLLYNCTAIALCSFVTYDYYSPLLRASTNWQFTDCLVHQAVPHIHHSSDSCTAVAALAAAGVVDHLQK